MFKLLRYLKEYRWIALMAPVFKLLECVFELFVPFVLTKIIDVGIANQDTDYIFRMCLLMFVLAVVGFLSAATAQYFAAKSSALFIKKVKKDTFAHIQSLSFSQLDELSSSTLITRMTADMNQIQTGVNLSLRLLLRSPIIVFGAMIMAFTIDAGQAMIFVAVIGLLGITVGSIMAKTLPMYGKVQQRLDEILRKTRENLNGVRVIRAFNMEERQIKDYVDSSDKLKQGSLDVGKIAALMNPLTFMIVDLGIVALFYAGAIKVDAGTLTGGQCVALYNYMSQILVELIKLASLIVTISKSITCGNRVQQILEIEPALTDQGGSFEDGQDSAIAFDHVYFNYHEGAKEALEDISFEIRKGDTVGIIGPTGSGKTSIAALIGRFYETERGVIKVLGSDVRKVGVSLLRQKIAMVFQKAVLFKGTVRSNLKWGNDQASDEELLQALKDSQAYDFIMEKEGLDTPVEQGGLNFSGGQRQRLCIARALVRKPEILILDDSASALDLLTEKKLRKAIRELPYRHTTIIISQRSASIRHAGQILVLDGGKLAGKGTHDELLKDCKVYQEIYYSQYPKGEGHE